MNTSQQLVDWYNQGLTIKQISEQTGINGRTLRSRYEAAGLEYCRDDYRNRSPWDLSKIFDPNSIDGQYVIGLLAADGYITAENRNVLIWIQEHDIELLHRVLYTLNRADAPIHYRQLPGHVSRQVGLSIGSIELVNYLVAHYGITQNKSRVLPFPTNLNNPLPFLRGFFDGDGYMGQACTFTVGSESFARGLLQWVFNVYGYEPNVQMVGMYKDIFNIHFRKKHERFIRDLFSYHGLTRKSQAYMVYLPN